MKHVQKFNEASIDTSIGSLDEIKNIESLIDDLDFKSQEVVDIISDINNKISSLTRSDSGLKEEAFEQVFSDLSDILYRLENSIYSIRDLQL